MGLEVGEGGATAWIGPAAAPSVFRLQRCGPKCSSTLLVFCNVETVGLLLPGSNVRSPAVPQPRVWWGLELGVGCLSSAESISRLIMHKDKFKRRVKNIVNQYKVLSTRFLCRVRN